MKDKKILSIWGGAGSGKTTLAKMLEKKYPDQVIRLPADKFTVGNKPFDSNYFNKPQRFDWQLIQSLTSNPIGTKVFAPDFDWTNFTRIASKGSRSFTIKKFIIVDAMAPYPFADYSVFIDLPDLVRKERVIKRDEESGIEVIKLWNYHKISLNYYSKQFKKNSDLVINGLDSIAVNYNRIRLLLNLI